MFAADAVDVDLRYAMFLSPLFELLCCCLGSSIQISHTIKIVVCVGIVIGKYVPAPISTCAGIAHTCNGPWLDSLASLSSCCASHLNGNHD